MALRMCYWCAAIIVASIPRVIAYPGSGGQVVFDPNSYDLMDASGSNDTRRWHDQIRWFRHQSALWYDVDWYCAAVRAARHRQRTQMNLVRIGSSRRTGTILRMDLSWLGSRMDFSRIILLVSGIFPKTRDALLSDILGKVLYIHIQALLKDP